MDLKRGVMSIAEIAAKMGVKVPDSVLNRKRSKVGTRLFAKSFHLTSM